MNITGLSLSELNSQIKESIRLAFPQSIWVVGDISELKVNSNGHCYLEMVEKDEKSDNIIAKQRAIIWSYTFRMLSPYFESSTGYKISAGIKILVNVQIEYHEIFGISLIIKDIDPAYTIGDMAQKKANVIMRLREEGVIDMNRMILFPLVPQRIAVISSKTAAGYGDFMSSLKKNTYGFSFHTTLFPAIMQGEKAEASIIGALDKIFDREEEFDTVVIIRGGGATSDLECFNNYNLVYHITQFPLPVITGIGHERDETIADLVAHTSMKTPTAVAEFIIGSVAEFYHLIEDFESRLMEKVDELINEEKQKLNGILKEINYRASGIIKEKNIWIMTVFQRSNFLCRQNSVKRHEKLQQFRYLTALHSRQSVKQNLSFVIAYKTALQKNISNLLPAKMDQLSAFEKSVDYLDPSNVLKRGYSISTSNGKIIKDSRMLEKGDVLISHFHKGESKSEVLSKIEVQ